MTLNQIFDSVVANHPDSRAVTSASRHYTYRELDRRAGTIARYLTAFRVGPGDYVGILLGSSFDLIASVIAVLRVGAAYLPLESSCPSERIAFMLGDAEVGLLLTDSELARGLEVTGHAHLFVDSIDEAGPKAEDGRFPEVGDAEPACLIYPSVSVDRQRGIVVTHRAITRRTIDPEYMRIESRDVLLQSSPVSSDASIMEIWGALLNGARLVLLPGGPASPESIASAVHQENVTALWLTSDMFKSLIDSRPEGLLPVRQIVTGGVILSVDHVSRAIELLPNRTLIHGYGSTAGTNRYPDGGDPNLGELTTDDIQRGRSRAQCAPRSRFRRRS